MFRSFARHEIAQPAPEAEASPPAENVRRVSTSVGPEKAALVSDWQVPTTASMGINPALVVVTRSDVIL
jgi:hypothetical protein